MPKSREDYTNANRIAWNEAASRHAVHNNAALLEGFKNSDFVTLTSRHGKKPVVLIITEVKHMTHSRTTVSCIASMKF